MLLSLSIFVESIDGSPIMTSEETQTQATEESRILTLRTTQIQPPEETQTRVTDKSVTMTTVIQSVEETQTQAVDGSETLTARNTYIPSAKETQTQCVKDSKAQAIAETPKLHTQVIDESTNWPKEGTEPQSDKEIWMYRSEDMETLATDQTQIPTAEETCTQAAEILATEEAQIKNPEETRTQMEESESEVESSSENERKNLTSEGKDIPL